MHINILIIISVWSCIQIHVCIFNLTTKATIIAVYMQSKNVTKHEKTGLMYTKCTSLYYGTYLLHCLRY